MTKIIRLEPHSMAIFASIDTDPGFAMSLCNDATLFSTVHAAMFTSAVSTADSRAEVAGIVEQLRENLGTDFGDGWIALRVGMADVTAFLMEKLNEAKAEERHADEQRFKEMKRREAAETRHALLRQALTEALGDKAAEIADKAAA